MLPKLLLTVFAIPALLFVAGVSGLLFHAWPTKWPDENITLKPPQLERLRALQRERKFVQDMRLHYPGAPNEGLRIALEKRVNGAIDRIAQGIQDNPRKSFVLGTFKQLLADTQTLDSEERDRLLNYFEQIMVILDIRSSNELLNVWRYGFPYGWFMSSSRS